MQISIFPQATTFGQRQLENKICAHSDHGIVQNVHVRRKEEEEEEEEERNKKRKKSYKEA